MSGPEVQETKSKKTFDDLLQRSSEFDENNPLESIYERFMKTQTVMLNLYANKYNCERKTILIPYKFFSSINIDKSNLSLWTTEDSQRINLINLYLNYKGLNGYIYDYDCRYDMKLTFVFYENNLLKSPEFISEFKASTSKISRHEAFNKLKDTINKSMINVIDGKESFLYDLEFLMQTQYIHAIYGNVQDSVQETYIKDDEHDNIIYNYLKNELGFPSSTKMYISTLIIKNYTCIANVCILFTTPNPTTPPSLIKQPQ